MKIKFLIKKKIKFKLIGIILFLSFSKIFGVFEEKQFSSKIKTLTIENLILDNDKIEKIVFNVKEADEEKNKIKII